MSEIDTPIEIKIPKSTKSWAEMSFEEDEEMKYNSSESSDSPSKNYDRKDMSSSSDNPDNNKKRGETIDDFIDPNKKQIVIISNDAKEKDHISSNNNNTQSSRSGSSVYRRGSGLRHHDHINHNIQNNEHNDNNQINNQRDEQNNNIDDNAEQKEDNINCDYGVNCKNYYCEKNHPPGRRFKCKFGEKCNRQDCKFLHPRVKTNECKFGINCTNDLCKFQHPGKKSVLHQGEELITAIKYKINQYWQSHPESKPLDIKIIERSETDEGIGCKYCYDAYKHSTQSDCPCRWTLKINKNGEFQEISCQDCKSLEWVKINCLYQNCLVDTYGNPYTVRLDTNGFPCKCIHPYAMCPYYGLLHSLKKYEPKDSKEPKEPDPAKKDD